MSEDLVAALTADSQAWAAPLVAGYASGNRRLLVKIERPGANVFDRTAGTWSSAERDLIYRGAARFWTVSATRDLGSDTGEQEALATQVSIDREPGVRPRQDDVLTVLSVDTNDSAEELMLTDAVFVVTAVTTGGQFGYGWHLTLTGVGPSPNDPEDDT